MLAIMGIVAAFTVPKILDPSRDRSYQYTQRAKHAALMIMTAYEKYRSTVGTVPTNMSLKALTPYMNYVSIDSSSTINHCPGFGSYSCWNSGGFCLNLHDGSKMQVSNDNFAGNSATNVAHAYFDPDGVNSSAADSLEILLYYDGTVRTWDTAKSNTCGSWSCPFGADPSVRPKWFNGF